MSASGEIVYAAMGLAYPGRGGVISGSTDRGVTWRRLLYVVDVQSWASIDTSDSGQYVVATARTNGLYFSHNYGLNWTKGSPPGNDFIDVKLSQDGQRCLVLDAYDARPNPLKLSTDGCETWTSLQAPRGKWHQLGASGDLSTIAFGSRAWAITISQDGGQSFTTHHIGSAHTTDEWRQIFVSESGTAIIGLHGHSLYRRPGWYTILSRVSTDGGATWGNLRDVLDFRVANSWRPSNAPNSLEDRGAFHAICASRNLQYIYLGESNGAYPNGRIWYTVDYGQSWQIDSGADEGRARYLADGACSADGQTVAFEEFQPNTLLWLLGPAPMPPSAPPPPPASPPPLPPQTPYFIRRPAFSRPGFVNGVYANAHGNAMLSTSGRIVAWGNPIYAYLNNPSDGYVTIASSHGAFSAIHEDGHLISWGGSLWGGSARQNRVIRHHPYTHGLRARVKYSNFIGISSTLKAFAAVDSLGQIYQWGKGYGLSGPRGLYAWSWAGPNIRETVPNGTGYSLPSSNEYAFATLDALGAVRAWGDPRYGGCDSVHPMPPNRALWATSSTCAPRGQGFTDIVSNRGGFAALASDGSIVAWGLKHLGARGVPSGTGFIKLYASKGSYLAL